MSNQFRRLANIGSLVSEISSELRVSTAAIHVGGAKRERLCLPHGKYQQEMPGQALL